VSFDSLFKVFHLFHDLVLSDFEHLGPDPTDAKGIIDCAVATTTPLMAPLRGEDNKPDMRYNAFHWIDNTCKYAKLVIKHTMHVSN